MQRVLCIFLAVIMAVPLAACSAPAAQETVSPTPGTLAAHDVVRSEERRVG